LNRSHVLRHLRLETVDDSRGVTLIPVMDEIRTNSSSIPYGIAPPAYRLPHATRLGPVHLQVADLSRSVAYYGDVIGLRVIERSASVAVLGAQNETSALLVLHERPDATPVPPRGRLGLFHVAILLPDRPSLGRFLAHLADLGEQPGMSDHYVSEAIYLTDPDGLALEIYADRPRAAWKAQDRQLVMGTVPLDVRSVLAAAAGEPWRGAPTGTTIGHVHLHVGDLTAASRFYHDVLGFDRVVWQYPGALFLSAGGYHHHLGTNTWARDAVSAREDEARLIEWTIDLPTGADVAALAESAAAHGFGPNDASAPPASILLRDPWGTAVRIRAAP
jgi:catechol 2,3-dioxygenase